MISQTAEPVVGKETARILLEHNAKVYIGCRSASKAADAVAELKRRTGKTDAELAVLSLDLSDLGSVKAAVDDFTSYVRGPVHGLECVEVFISLMDIVCSC